MAGKKQRIRDKLLLYLSKNPRSTTQDIANHMGKGWSQLRTTKYCLHMKYIGLLATEDDAWRLESDPPMVGVFDFLNAKTGSHFRPYGRDGITLSKNADFILARLEDGITVDQMLRIIAMKVSEWRGTTNAIYLRPQTLFNETKCETYLAQLSSFKSSGPSEWLEKQ